MVVDGTELARFWRGLTRGEKPKPRNCCVEQRKGGGNTQVANLRYSHELLGGGRQDKTTTIMRISTAGDVECSTKDKQRAGTGREKRQKSPNHNTRGRAVDIVSKASSAGKEEDQTWKRRERESRG